MVPAALAQHISKDLTGAVTNGDGQPVANARVKLQNPKTRRIRSYITGPDGKYRFRHLPGDVDFKVWATAKGRKSSDKSMSSFNTDGSPVLDLTIK